MSNYFKKRARQIRIGITVLLSIIFIIISIPTYKEFEKLPPFLQTKVLIIILILMLVAILINKKSS